MEYVVEDSDTVERIAAKFECTVGQLMKMNKMSSRMVFAGQTLIVPSPMSDDVFEESKGQNGLFPSPGTAVQVTPQQPVAQQRSRTVTKTRSEPFTTTTQNKLSKYSVVETDVDCLQRFLKVKVKNVTENDGTVTGTLLVTPNAIMFDPDVTHPLVKENGQDLYMMMAPMADITSVAVFKDIGALTGEKDQDTDIYDPEHVSKLSTGTENSEDIGDSSEKTVQKEDLEPIKEPEICKETPDMAGDQKVHDYGTSRTLCGSESQLSLIAEEDQKSDIGVDIPVNDRRAVSTAGSPQILPIGESLDESKLTSSLRRKGFASQHLETSPSTSRALPKEASSVGTRNSFAKLSRTLSARANSIRDSAEKVTQSAVIGTKSMAHGVVTHTKLAAETLHTGLQSGAKLAATHAKVAANAVVSVPQGIVNISTGLFSEGQQPETFEAKKDTRTEANIRRQQSLATLEDLKQKTLQAREQASKERETSLFTCAVSPEDKPELFRPIQEIVDEARRKNDITAPLVTTELPYYMASSRSTSTTNSTSSEFDGELVGNKTRREFWFAIPRKRVDGIYHFLLQCNPEKYGQDVSPSDKDESIDDTYSSSVSGYRFYDNSFLVLDSKVDEKLAGQRVTFASVFHY